MNLPIYRGQKVDSEEWVEGYLYPHLIDNNKWYIFQIDNFSIEINPETLSIHFENMLDKNGKKIFASLSEDGVGGDCCKDTYNEKYICLYNAKESKLGLFYTAKQGQVGYFNPPWQTLAIIGIHQ